MRWWLILACAGCEPEPRWPGPPADTGTEAPLVADWTPCDLRPLFGDGAAECATLTLPLDPLGAGDDVLVAFVKRIPATGTERAQVWMLAGGPGASAVDDLWLLERGLPALRRDVGFYAVDHRGVGGTERLGCDQQEARVSPEGRTITEEEWGPCLDALIATKGARLPHINVSSSARDLVAILDVVAPTTPVFLYGSSYGTYLALRLLQIAPNVPSGVVLEGVMHPARGLDGFDAAMDAAGHALLARCGADPDCAAHFPGDPAEAADAVVASLDQGHCAALGLDGDDARVLLGTVVSSAEARHLAPAVVHRLSRCEADDVTVLHRLVEVLTPGGADPNEGNRGQGQSTALFHHVALSELWTARDAATTLGAWRDLTVATGLETWLAARAPGWPTYPPDVFDDRLPVYNGPLLLLQGGLDPVTPADVAAEVGAHFAGGQQTQVVFADGGHAVVGATPLGDETDCARQLVLGFLDDPTSPPDRACVDAVLPLDFDGSPVVNLGLLGTQSAWD